MKWVQTGRVQPEMKRFIARAVMTIVALGLLVVLLWSSRHRVRTSYAEQQIHAAEQMKTLSAQVRAYKAEAGIPLSKEDRQQTGLLGEDYHSYTTSLGDPAAKRTSTDPDMAALMVRYFHQLHLKPGDRIGLAFSGSFPGLNLATLAASEQMQLNPVICSSFGASTFGANQPELSFPELLHRLVEDGLLSKDSDLVTLGGDADVLKDKEEEQIRFVVERYQSLGLPLYQEPDEQKNVAYKGRFFQKDGPIRAFVAVGGNMTFFGRNAGTLANHQGILYPGTIRNVYGSKDGLLGYFLHQNIPVIHMLNLKKIVADAGLPFDPMEFQPTGSSAIYFETHTSPALAIGGLLLIAAVSLWVWIDDRRKIALERTEEEETGDAPAAF